MDNKMEIDFNGEKPKVISYYEHEVEVARSEVHSKRWMIAAIIAFAALIITNAGWIVHESLYVDEYSATQTVTQEGDGTNTFTGDFYGGGDGKADNNKDSN